MSFHVDGLDRFMLTMEQLAKIPGETLREMTEAGGREIEKHIKAAGYGMGVYDTSTTLESATLGTPRIIPGGAKVYVTFKGINADGNRNAEVAFVNEYGRHRTKPYAGRPFVSMGTTAAADDATEAAAEVYGRWLDGLD